MLFYFIVNLLQSLTAIVGDVEINKEELPFAGELLQVNEKESAWEGAIEKLLRDTGISMLAHER